MRIDANPFLERQAFGAPNRPATPARSVAGAPAETQSGTDSAARRDDAAGERPAGNSANPLPPPRQVEASVRSEEARLPRLLQRDDDLDNRTRQALTLYETLDRPQPEAVEVLSGIDTYA